MKNETEEIPESKSQLEKEQKLWYKRPIFQVILFLPLIVLMSGDLGVFIANEVLIVVNLNITPGQIGYVIAIQYITNGIFTFIFGYLSDKMSRKKLLILGGSLWVLASFLTSQSWDFWSLVFFRIIAAIGIGAQSPVTFSMLSDLFPSEARSNSFAWWGIATLVGGLFSGSLALAFNTIPTAALDQDYGSFQEKIQAIADNYAAECVHWREPFLYIAIIGLIFVFLCFLVREPKRAAQEKALRDVLTHEDVDYGNQYTINKEDLKFVYKRKTNIFLVLNFFDCVTSGVITSYLFLYITMDLGFEINFSAIGIDTVFLLIGVLIALGLALWGQFYFARLGDKWYNQGDLRGRIKMMTYCAIFMVPFLCAAFLISPSLGTKTIFNIFTESGIAVTPPVFWIVFMIMFVLLGLGLAGSFGGTPNWYASMIDGNLPEQRGTMIAIASFMDTIGRSVGAAAGGFFFDLFNGSGVGAPISLMLLTVQAIFGVISIFMTFPALYTASEDFKDVQDILEKRADELEEIAESRGNLPNQRNTED